MRLAKQAMDIGLYTDRREEMLAFWQQTAGVPFDELLPLGGGVQQHRHRIGDSILKINHSRESVPDLGASGYRELVIARHGLDAPRSLVDPDGNRLRLVPMGHDGVEQIEIKLLVRDARAHTHFYEEILGLPRAGKQRVRCGASLIAFEESPQRSAQRSIESPQRSAQRSIESPQRSAQRSIESPTVTAEPEMRARGFRYTTVQVFDVVNEHRTIVERGGREGRAPVRLGEVAYISFVRDPDGNWIEISQRKSLTGSLD